MGSLSFAHPLILSGLLVLPILWWLLRATPPAATRTPFGALIFLRDLENTQDSPARTPWWLLLLRMMILGLIIIGLAGPIWNAVQRQNSDAPLLIIVDDTWPAAIAWPTRIEAVEKLKLQRGADRRTARILTTAPPVRLTELMPLNTAIDSIAGLTPKARLSDRAASLKATADLKWSDYDVYWLGDGVIGRRAADRAFLKTIGTANSAALFRIPGETQMAITSLTANAGGMSIQVNRIDIGVATGSLMVTAKDGRILTQTDFAFPDRDRVIDVDIRLPLELRNEVARISIAGQRSAGATWLADAGNRRIRAGLVSEDASTLLGGGFYISQAIQPYAEILQSNLAAFMVPEVGLIILDDIGTIRAEETRILRNWMEQGGILLRFAGASTAASDDARRSGDDAIFPAPLRGTERAFGGALTWDDPQPIAPFDAQSPLAGLDVSKPIFVRRQVLSKTSTDTDYAVWARLADGTPLITARAIGEGYVILIHVTATPAWSDLPISGLFPPLMARVARLAAGAPTALPAKPIAPFRLLDGFGVLTDPSATAKSASPEDITRRRAAPGYYGSLENQLAVNTYAKGGDIIDPLTFGLLPSNVTIEGPEGNAARALGIAFLLMAFGLFLLDGALMSRQNRQKKSASVLAVVAFVFAFNISTAPFSSSAAQEAFDFRPDLSENTIEATLQVHFAYVITGDANLDRMSRAGLYGLSREATRRTALEPGAPIGVDIEREDLSVYPLIYWPIQEGIPVPTDAALFRLERFMASGGLLIIDTQDGEFSAISQDTGAARTLRAILRRMDIPPLEPLPDGHILTRSFYLLNALAGRNNQGTVWVEANGALSEATDRVPTIVIGSRDWASAWALDEGGRPLRSAGVGGERNRELAFRAGINLAMVALTGNYKGDQIHVRELLDRLGTEEEDTP